MSDVSLYRLTNAAADIENAGRPLEAQYVLGAVAEILRLRAELAALREPAGDALVEVASDARQAVRP